MTEPILYLSDFEEEHRWFFICPICKSEQDTYLNPREESFLPCDACGVAIDIGDNI
jgi:translation initiation factor 2 beta subunit (eIF-2beta)/eIF-5